LTFLAVASHPTATLRADETPAPNQQEPSGLKSVLDKPAPESIAELKEIQRRTRVILEKVVPCTVGLQIGGASGSGVIVSEDGYVLTAGHVSGEPGQKVIIIMPDGKQLKGKTLGANQGIDSGMIKIDTEDKLPFIEMGNSKAVKKGQWCIAVGHPGGYKEGRAPVVRVGRVIDVRDSVLRTDCTLVGGDSGGPLFDFEGKIIGIHSRIGGTITSNMHVPVDTYRQTWDRLVSGEKWGGIFTPGNPVNDPYYGFQLDPETDVPTIKKVVAGSPAEKAGFEAGDVIMKFQQKAYDDRAELQSAIKRKKPNDEVTFEVERDGETITIKMKVGKRDS